MRFLIAIVFGCALIIGFHQAASPGATGRDAAPATEIAPPAADNAVDETEPENETSYECKYSPYCQRASQCTAYCAGGIPVCFQGCCSCAS